jgi:hypothetical protein
MEMASFEANVAGDTLRVQRSPDATAVSDGNGNGDDADEVTVPV